MKRKWIKYWMKCETHPSVLFTSVSITRVVWRNTLQNHHRKGTYKCDTRRIFCYTEQSLAKHRKIRSYFFKCNMCHKRKETLQRHQVWTHSDTVQFFLRSVIHIKRIFSIKRKHSASIYTCRYYQYRTRAMSDLQKIIYVKRQPVRSTYSYVCWYWAV